MGDREATDRLESVRIEGVRLVCNDAPPNQLYDVHVRAGRVSQIVESTVNEERQPRLLIPSFALQTIVCELTTLIHKTGSHTATFTLTNVSSWTRRRWRLGE
jgi:hypothetical protein